MAKNKTTSKKKDGKKSKSIAPTNKKSKSTNETIPKNSLITQYFNQKESQNSNDINIDEQRHTEKNDFYGDCLSSKINSCGMEKNCHEIKRNLKHRLNINKQKEAHIQECIKKCAEVLAQKNDRIKSLENQVHQLSAASTSTDTGTQMNKTKTPILFEQFNDALAENQLSTLRSIEKSKKGDSTFILNCVRFLYSDGLARLTHKSMYGASKGEPKEPITPQKLTQMEAMYVERLNSLVIEEAEKIDREKKFNRHINRAITNINASQKSEKDNIKVIQFKEK